MPGLLLLTVLACRLGSPEPEPIPVSSVTGAVSEVPGDGAAAALVASLRSKGWSVQQGLLESIPLDECCAWDTCYARNPSSHYAMYRLPLSPEEAPRAVDEAGMSFQFRMRADEAVVFIGRTPPPAAYFSFRTYVHESHDADAGAMEIAFSSLGDSLNNGVIGTAGDSPTAPFGATTALVSVSDAGTEARVREHMIAAGVAQAAINVDVVPAERVRLGLDAEADTLRMNLRMALFEDPAAQASYLADPEGVVLRLTPPLGASERSPLAVPPSRVAGGGPTEQLLQPAADALRLAVRDAFSPDYLLREATVAVNQPPADGPCWPGCNTDSTYAGSQRFVMPFTQRKVQAIAFGVNHEASGLAAYSNVILIGYDNNDPAGFVDSRMMVGSARPYLPDHPLVDQLYVWRFSRDCGGEPFCSEVSAGCPGLTAMEQGRLQWRTYLDPRTHTHADADAMVTDGAFLLIAKP